MPSKEMAEEREDTKKEEDKVNRSSRYNGFSYTYLISVVTVGKRRVVISPTVVDFITWHAVASIK